MVLKDTTSLIEWDRLYRPSEIAKKGDQNPAGLGLLDFTYLTVLRKVKNSEIPSIRADGGGSKYERYLVRGADLIEYIKRGAYKIKGDQND